jgi:hypothetical protein
MQHPDVCVSPSQVNEPHHPGPVAVVVDCPDEEYLPSLMDAPIWKQFWKQVSNPSPFGGSSPPVEDAPKGVDVMCHLAPIEVSPRQPIL